MRRLRAGDVGVAAAVAALVSGAPSTLHAVVTGRGVLDATAAAGTLLLPARSSRLRLVLAGGVAHVAISAGWAAVLAAVLPRRRTATWGGAAGLAIAAVDLGLVARRLPAIRSLSLVPQLADHVAFGTVVGAVLARRRSYDPRHVSPQGHLHRLP